LITIVFVLLINRALKAMVLPKGISVKIIYSIGWFLELVFTSKEGNPVSETRKK
jgi:hypothetical protein